MVVVHAQPSTSTGARKKTRRTMSKKKSRKGVNQPQDDTKMHDDTTPTDLTEAAKAAIVEEDAAIGEDDEVMIDTDPDALPSQSAAPAFPPLSASAQRAALKSETRRIPIPPHRMTPLKKEWVNIFGPLTEILGLQVRMNVPRRCVEIRVCKIHYTPTIVCNSYHVDVKTHKGNWRPSKGC